MLLANYSAVVAQQEIPTDENKLREAMLARKERLKKIYLKLEIVPDYFAEPQLKFRVGDSIYVKIMATNSSSQTFYFKMSGFDNPCQPILLKNGEEVAYSQKGKELSTPLKEPMRSSNISVTLSPFKETKLGVLNLSDWYDPLEAGIYQVKYLCSLDRGVVKNLYNLNKGLVENLYNSDKGLVEVESGSVTFEVLPKE